MVALRYRTAKCHTLHKACTSPPVVTAHLPACWAWRLQLWPQTMKLLLGDLSTEMGLVLQGAQEKNCQCHKPCWGGWLSLKRRMMLGRKAKDKTNRSAEQKAWAFLFWVGGVDTSATATAAGLRSAPCSKQSRARELGTDLREPPTHTCIQVCPQLWPPHAGPYLLQGCFISLLPLVYSSAAPLASSHVSLREVFSTEFLLRPWPDRGKGMCRRSMGKKVLMWAIKQCSTSGVEEPSFLVLAGLSRTPVFRGAQ